MDFFKRAFAQNENNKFESSLISFSTVFGAFFSIAGYFFFLLILILRIISSETRFRCLRIEGLSLLHFYSSLTFRSVLLINYLFRIRLVFHRYNLFFVVYWRRWECFFLFVCAWLPEFQHKLNLIRNFFSRFAYATLDCCFYWFMERRKLQWRPTRKWFLC